MTLLRGITSNRRSSSVGRLAMIVLAGLSLSACGRQNQGAATVGQVIAHIGPDDITLQELQNEMRVMNIPPEKQKDDAVTKAILSEIASRKYVVQQAVAAKMDRQPTILLDILRSREQVLAGAFVQRQMGEKSAGIGKGELDKFIQAHPNQFAGRQEFEIDEISFQAPKEMDDIAATTKDFKTLEQVDSKLNELGIKHVRHPGVIDGGTLPDNVLAQLKAQKSDEIFLLRAGEGATFFKVTDAKSKPLSGDDAQRVARRALQQEMLKSLSADTAKAAVSSAKFEGDYDRIMNGATGDKK